LNLQPSSDNRSTNFQALTFDVGFSSNEVIAGANASYVAGQEVTFQLQKNSKGLNSVRYIKMDPNKVTLMINKAVSGNPSVVEEIELKRADAPIDQASKNDDSSGTPAQE